MGLIILTLYTMELYSILKIKPSFKGTVEDVSPQMTGWVQCALSCCLTVQQLARVSAAPSLTTHHLTTALVTIDNSDQDPTPPPLSSQHYKVSCQSHVNWNQPRRKTYIRTQPEIQTPKLLLILHIMSSDESLIVFYNYYKGFIMILYYMFLCESNMIVRSFNGSSNIY